MKKNQCDFLNSKQKKGGFLILLILQNNNNNYNLINYCCFKLFFDLLDEYFHFRESVRKYAWIWITYYGTKNNIFTWNDFSIFQEIN